MFKMVHENYNVLDLDRSLKFYEDALGLTQKRRIDGDGFTICFVGNDNSEFLLELTCMHDRKEPYNLGDNEIHLAFMAEDYDAAYKKHKEMGCVCYENPAMGIYFISDPDGYWLEVVPKRA